MLERYRVYTGLFCGAMWVLLCYGFIRDEFLPFLAPLQPFVNVLCDLIFLILGVATIRSRRDIVMVISLLVITLISKYLNHQGVSEWVNGLRSYIGLVLTVPFIRYMLSREDYAVRFTKSMDKQLLWFLFIQAFCVTWQFIRYGACDWGGGSMGYGHSGVVSTLICLISFYLITKKWDFSESYFTNLRVNKLYIILLFPTFLNETKISFFFILGYFIFLMKMDRRIILRIIMASPLAIIAFFLLGYVYISVTGADSDRLLSEEFFKTYLVGEDIQDLAALSIMVEEEDIETDNLWAVDLPRFGRFFLLPDAMKASGGGMLFGAGVGQFKGNHYFSKSAFSRKYAWLLKGSTPLIFTWLVQLGFVGLVWFFINLITILFTPNKSPSKLNLRMYLGMVFTLILAYQDQFALVYYCAIVFYICLEGLQPEYNHTEELQSQS